MLDRLQNLSTRDKVVLAAAVGVAGYVAYQLYKSMSGKKPPEYGDQPAEGTSPLLASSEVKQYMGNVNYYDVVGRGATSPIYGKPDTSSPVIGAFTRGTQVDSTLLMADTPKGTFAQVRLPSGGAGWMLVSDLQTHNPDNTSIAAKVGPLDSVVSTLSNLWS